LRIIDIFLDPGKWPLTPFSIWSRIRVVMSFSSVLTDAFRRIRWQDNTSFGWFGVRFLVLHFLRSRS
jgi:hypothetical protein